MGVMKVPKKIWMNGNMVLSEQASVSVFDHGLLYGDGVFEGIRLYNGRVFKLATHLRRLFESARVIRLAIPFNFDDLVRSVHETVEANGITNGYIRLCVTRGTGTLGINPFKCTNPCVFIIVDSIELYPAELYRDGLTLITSSIIRNHPAALSPQIKSMNYLNNILAKIEAVDAGLLEAVMLNQEGLVAECTGDNIFVVRRGSADRPALCTPSLLAGILEGVTRNVVIELAREAGIEVSMTDLSKDDLYIADEVFLTGTAAEVVPVTRIDGREIGDGKLGAVTCQLMEVFSRLVAKDAPED